MCDRNADVTSQDNVPKLFPTKKALSKLEKHPNEANLSKR